MPTVLSDCLIDGIWESLRDLETKTLGGILADDTRSSLWTDIYKLHYFLRSHEYEDGGSFRIDYATISKTWSGLCFEYLPLLEHAKLREELESVEHMLAPAMRHRFSPESGSLIDREEKARIE
ncbi:hypothetical protein SCHPADRAFT_514947 [Schizopora paradoxa]|uniref:Uncharacterized protein n=1 Tax=Schizopora paradoxa TaxID=27342 RepID=A0A0H2RM20_9AGAM|nr:hypothetical protein SCHPADRAFT_514947 [Schizopora paradoxa]